MKFRGTTLLLLCLVFGAFAQKKAPVKPKMTHRNLAEPKVFFEYMPAGKSKQYSVKNKVIKCSIKGTSPQNNKIDMSVNDVALLNQFSVAANSKNQDITSKFNIVLERSTTTIKFHADKASTLDSFTINFTLSDTLNDYVLTARCSKSKTNVIILKK